MKKILLVFLAFAFVSSFAFAELAGGGADSATMTGSVSLTSGYDLDTEGFGFVNDTDVTVTLPLLSGTGGASGDDGVYAEISVAIGWELQDGGFNDTVDDSDGLTADGLTADISATIFFNSLYLALEKPDFEVNNVDIDNGDYIVDAYADAFDNGGGFSLGYKSDMIDIAFMVASEKDAYRDTASDGEAGADADEIDPVVPFSNGTDEVEQDLYTPNTDADLIFGVTATITAVEGIKVPVKFMYDAKSGTATEDLMAFGAAPSVKSGSLTFDFPVDYVKYGDATGLELKPALGYEVMENFKVSTSFLYGTYNDVFIGSGLAAVEIKNAVAELTAGVADSGAFVEGLAWSVDVSFTDILNYLDTTTPDGYLPLSVDGKASFSQNGMKPYMSTSYDFSNAVLELGLGVEFGADFTGIDNTVITLDYANDAIMDGEAYTGDTDGDTEKGRVTLDIKVSF